MAEFVVVVTRVVTNGPYAYVVNKNMVGQKAAHSFANIGAALDAIKADLSSMLGGETVDFVRMEIRSG